MNFQKSDRKYLQILGLVAVFILLISGINFANGVAVSPDQQFVLVNETGSYRVIRYWISGAKQGQ